MPICATGSCCQNEAALQKAGLDGLDAHSTCTTLWVAKKGQDTTIYKELMNILHPNCTSSRHGKCQGFVDGPQQTLQPYYSYKGLMHLNIKGKQLLALIGTVLAGAGSA